MRKYPFYQHVHFVGIGGIGMSGIAEVLINLGYKVSGSDIKESDITKRLESLGAKIFIGHDKENIRGADVVVYSSAITEDNPEVEEARKLRHIPVIPRAEMLAEIMRMKHSILVAGAHGKTTTTSMIGTLLVAGNFDPTVVIGGRLKAWGSNAKMGTGDFFVAEADESDGSFLMLSPTIAVVTNIDREHLDYYRDINHIAESFIKFVNKVPFYGSAILCLDDEKLRSMVIPHVKRRFITYGFSEEAEVRAEDVVFEGFHSNYRLVINGHLAGSVNLKVPGLHNVLNSLAAVSVGLELGMDPQEIIRGLEQFSGVERRFHVKGKIKGVTVVDDYGHHPEEIRAVIKTLRCCFPDKRKIILFQPHRYTRTKALMDDFVFCFDGCDVLIVTQIYSAGEKPIAGVDGKVLAEKIARLNSYEVLYASTLESALAELLKLIKSGDVLLTLGAGNVWTVGNRLLEMLRNGEVF